LIGFLPEINFGARADVLPSCLDILFLEKGGMAFFPLLDLFLRIGPVPLSLLICHLASNSSVLPAVFLLSSVGIKLKPLSSAVDPPVFFVLWLVW